MFSPKQHNALVWAGTHVYSCSHVDFYQVSLETVILWHSLRWHAQNILLLSLRKTICSLSRLHGLGQQTIPLIFVFYTLRNSEHNQPRLRKYGYFLNAMSQWRWPMFVLLDVKSHFINWSYVCLIVTIPSDLWPLKYSSVPSGYYVHVHIMDI